MKKFAIVAAALLVGSVSHAANIACSGSYLGYNFNVNARTSGARVGGRISVLVTTPSGSAQRASLTPTSSSAFCLSLQVCSRAPVSQQLTKTRPKSFDLGHSLSRSLVE